MVIAAAVAVAGAQPTAATVAGAAAAAVCAAAAVRLTSRTPTRTGRSAQAVLAGLVVAVFAVSLVVPPSARQPALDPGSTAFWDLPTGSRLAHARLPGVGFSRAAPVVVLHGGPGIPDTARSVRLYAPLARLGFDVEVYEQLGAGRSTRATDPRTYGIDRDVADLEAIRQQLGVPRLILVGSSYGGALAASYLAAYPEHVEAMLLVSPGTLDPDDHIADRATSRLGVVQRAQCSPRL
jgi:proline iminopeptidase